MRAHMAADHHVFQRRHVAEQADVLERARDARLDDPVGLEPDQIAAVEFELAAVRHVKPGEHVEQRGLAGAVGTDQAVDLAAA